MQLLKTGKVNFQRRKISGEPFIHISEEVTQNLFKIIYKIKEYLQNLAHHMKNSKDANYPVSPKSNHFPIQSENGICEVEIVD